MKDTFIKITLRVFAIIFGLAGLVMLFYSGISSMIWILISAGLWYRSGSADRSRKRIDALIQEASRYFSKVNESGEFPAAKSDRIIEREENPILAACNAILFEIKSDGARHYLGTRVKIGSIPVYLGGSHGNGKHLMQTASGELAITSEDLIFSSQSRSVDIPLWKINSVDIAPDGFHVSVKDRQSPFVFTVQNGILWGYMVKNLVKIKMNGRKLPSGAYLALE